MRMRWTAIGLTTASLLCGIGVLRAEVRIKDITDLEGARNNQLFGFGLVVGLLQSGLLPDIASRLRPISRTGDLSLHVLLRNRSQRTETLVSLKLLAKDLLWFS